MNRVPAASQARGSIFLSQATGVCVPPMVSTGSASAMSRFVGLISTTKARKKAVRRSAQGAGASHARRAAYKVQATMEKEYTCDMLGARTA